MYCGCRPPLFVMKLSYVSEIFEFKHDLSYSTITTDNIVNNLLSSYVNYNTKLDSPQHSLQILRIFIYWYENLPQNRNHMWRFWSIWIRGSDDINTRKTLVKNFMTGLRICFLVFLGNPLFFDKKEQIPLFALLVNSDENDSLALLFLKEQQEQIVLVALFKRATRAILSRRLFKKRDSLPFL